MDGKMKEYLVTALVALVVIYICTHVEAVGKFVGLPPAA